MLSEEDRIAGCLLGAAIGDALGLPYENLSSRRAVKLLGLPDRFRFLLGWGMVSDDAEHAMMTASALAKSKGSVKQFQKHLARNLRWWLLTIPAGIGLATLKSILKLWIGFPPDKSGVMSAGNGPAMRSAILGIALGADHSGEFVKASSNLTHRDERAYIGALIVALAACCGGDLDFFRHQVDQQLSIKDQYGCGERMLQMIRSIEMGQATSEFASEICRIEGFVTGYILETVPVAVHAAFSCRSEPDFVKAIQPVIRCGGDTDSTAAIRASILGSWRGYAAIRSIEIARIIELRWGGEQLIQQLSRSIVMNEKPPSLPFFKQYLKSLIQIPVVLIHCFRRFMPPY